jgi:hypothetical protein
MRKSLYLYLFILAVLINVFTYAYFTKEGAFEKEQLEKHNKKLNDSITSISQKIADANYFSLEYNQNAQNYLEMSATNGRYIPYDKLIPLVTEKLLDLNENPKGNPYTGQEQLGAQKFIINKVKVLNHRWIIADYSDGEYWGEVLLKYFVNEDESVNYVIMDSFLYPKQTN